MICSALEGLRMEPELKSRLGPVPHQSGLPETEIALAEAPITEHRGQRSERASLFQAQRGFKLVLMLAASP
jgi:hypothetical protein